MLYEISEGSFLNDLNLSMTIKLFYLTQASKDLDVRPGVMTHNSNPNTQEDEAGRWLQV
jgi:hypothetical protein